MKQVIAGSLFSVGLINYRFKSEGFFLSLQEIKQNGTSSKEGSPKTENVEGRFKKNFLKHLRHTQETPPAIETIVIENGVSECEESSTEEDCKYCETLLTN